MSCRGIFVRLRVFSDSGSIPEEKEIYKIVLYLHIVKHRNLII